MVRDRMLVIADRTLLVTDRICVRLDAIWGSMFVMLMIWEMIIEIPARIFVSLDRMFVIWDGIL